MGLFNKQKKPEEVFVEAPSSEPMLEDSYDDTEEEEPMQQQIKKTVQGRPKGRPAQTPQPQQKQTIIEREITLSTINDKLNFIINKIQEAE